MQRRMLMLALVAAVLAAGCASTPTPTPSPNANAPGKCTSTIADNKSSAEPIWVLVTSKGTARITLFCDKAPVTTQSIVNLTEKGFYDGTLFHRVIKDFMDQGGDPNTKSPDSSMWGQGGPGYTLPEEFYCADGTIDYHTPAQCAAGLGLKHDTAGVASMARTNAPHSTGSQFFLVAAPSSFLDGKYSVFGHTVDQDSTDVVLAINNSPTNSQDQPTPSISLKKATIEWT